MISVSDDGNGIAPENMEKVFEPFFTTKEVGKGTGLGLATVYGIIKQNKGFINFYSEPGEGTVFKIYLPRHSGPTENSKRRESVEIPPSRGETVLLVEDDAAILSLGQAILSQLGYEVLSASNPNDAIEEAKDHTGIIDLLITDIVMPRMNGRVLSERLAEVYPHMKTLFVSGYTANVIADRGVLQDDVFFLSKPFSMEELAFKIRELLG
jgi:CheY-like chemotaxis protein